MMGKNISRKIRPRVVSDNTFKAFSTILDSNGTCPNNFLLILRYIFKWPYQLLGLGALVLRKQYKGKTPLPCPCQITKTKSKNY